MEDKRKKYVVELTLSQEVELLNALRDRSETLFKLVIDALEGCDYAAAVVHEQRIADTIKVFGKFC